MPLPRGTLPLGTPLEGNGMRVMATSTQIHIRPAAGVWSARAGGALVARSDRALELIEGALAPVIYFPREDVAMDLLERDDSLAVCPHKGRLQGFGILTPASRIAAAAWSCEAPRQHLGAIAGYLAFAADRVMLSEEPAGSTA